MKIKATTFGYRIKNNEDRMAHVLEFLQAYLVDQEVFHHRNKRGAEYMIECSNAINKNTKGKLKPFKKPQKVTVNIVIETEE